jgi:hypothetical protein
MTTGPQQGIEINSRMKNGSHCSSVMLLGPIVPAQSPAISLP